MPSLPIDNNAREPIKIEDLRKRVEYSLPGVKIGNGKYHPIEIMIYNNDLFALKKIPKSTIDKQKRIDHLKNEKRVC